MSKKLKFAAMAAMAAGALMFSGCEDQAAIQRQEAAERKAKEAYKADYDSANQNFVDAQARESANQLQQAQVLYEQAASIATSRATEPGEQKMKFTAIQNQAKAAAERVKAQIETNTKVAEAEAAKKIKDAELAKKAAAEKIKKDKETTSTASLTPSATVGDATAPKPAVAPGGAPTPAADDDPIPVKGADGAAAAEGEKPKTDDIFKPYDDKATFKCYKVVSQKKYAIAYVILKNTFDKEKKVIRFNADLATAKGDDHWPVAAFYKVDDFKAKNWNDLDGDNPDAIGPERLSLAAGEEVKLVLMSNVADHDGEYAKAVKLTGSVIWADNSESNVINNN